MDQLDVRIIRLEPLRVVCLNGFGDSPEGLAWDKLVAWAKERGLWQDGRPRRFFGYNNPDPSPGSPNYGYDAWMTLEGYPVDENPPAGAEARFIAFPGGLYAVTRCQGVENIFLTWQRLVAWLENSRFRMGSHQWLEEHLSLLDSAPEAKFTLDLYLPVRA